jgi:hypothetical protein
MRTTLRNIDRVLGVKSPTVKIRRDRKPLTPAPSVLTVPVMTPEQELNFADFVEKVNGRCAITGLYIGKAMFQFSGQDLVQQLTTDPVMAGVLVGSDFTLVTLLTLAFYKPTDYDNLIEFGVKVMYRFAMLQWVWIIGGYIF